MPFGNDCISESMVQRRLRKFKTGDDTLNDEPREGNPSIINDYDLRGAIDTDPNATCKTLAIRFYIRDETDRTHLHKMGKMNRVGKWVPHRLTNH